MAPGKLILRALAGAQSGVRLRRPVSRRSAAEVPSCTARTGAAGADWTAGMLAVHGWDASPTSANAPPTDILAHDHGHQALIAVQPKTKSGKGWFMLNQAASRLPLRGGTSGSSLMSCMARMHGRSSNVVLRDAIAAYISCLSWLSVWRSAEGEHDAGR